jgi:hypothetical protein
MTKTEKLIVKEFKRIIKETPREDWELESRVWKTTLKKRTEPRVFIQKNKGLNGNTFYLCLEGMCIEPSFWSSFSFYSFFKELEREEQEFEKKANQEALERYNVEFLERLTK